MRLSILKSIVRAPSLIYAERLRQGGPEGPHAGKVGAFEGANYEARGFYRPQADCIMFTRDNVPFCVVCRRAIEQILDLYSR